MKEIKFDQKPVIDSKAKEIKKDTKKSEAAKGTIGEVRRSIMRVASSENKKEE